jgi:putative hydrolase of the HAD superfamily
VNLTAVLFDLNGTLLDHDAACVAAIRSWLPPYGVAQGDIETAVTHWFELEQRHYPAWRAGEISFQEQRRRRTRDFFHTLGIPVQAEEVNATFAGYLAGYEAAWIVFDDAASTLRRVAAANLRIGVLTNRDLADQTAKLLRTFASGSRRRC